MAGSRRLASDEPRGTVLPMTFRVRAIRLLAVLSLCAAAVAQQPVAARAVHGRLEEHGGIKLLRVWGTPAERGYAHGFLLGKDVAAVAIEEFTARFARQQPLLEEARRAVGRLIEYPDDVKAEIEALFEGVVASKADLQMPELERSVDLKACSSATRSTCSGSWAAAASRCGATRWSAAACSPRATSTGRSRATTCSSTRCSSCSTWATGAPSPRSRGPATSARFRASAATAS